jgi:hypothetical protein
MASLNSLQTRALAAQTTGIRVVEDGPIAFRIIHTSTASAVVASNAATLVLTDGVNGATTVTYGATTTLGAVVDKINGTADWKAKLLDGYRSKDISAGNCFITGTLTANAKYGEIGYDVYLDTTNAFLFAVRATYDRSASDNKPKGHRVKIDTFEYVMNVNAAAADMVKIYEWDPVLKTETEIWQAPSVDSTSTVTSFDFSKAPMTAKEDCDLIVVVTDASAITDASTNYLQVLYTRE